MASFILNGVLAHEANSNGKDWSKLHIYGNFSDSDANSLLLLIFKLKIIIIK